VLELGAHRQPPFFRLQGDFIQMRWQLIRATIRFTEPYAGLCVIRSNDSPGPIPPPGGR
jgi:hypothetical protein